MSADYVLIIDKSVGKDLLEFAPKLYKQIVTKILSLPTNPKPQDCKSLEGVPGGYRVDQGEYRILYYIVEPTKTDFGQIQVFRVGKRNDGEVYRNL